LNTLTDLSGKKLLDYKKELAAFVQQIGLTLTLEEEDGYAYLKHTSLDEDEPEISWMQRRTLTYEESVLLILFAGNDGRI